MKIKHKGVSLVQTMLALTVLSGTVVGLAKVASDWHYSQLGGDAAQAVSGADQAYTQYAKDHWRDLIAGAGVSGVANAWKPTPAELLKLGYGDRAGLSGLPNGMAVLGALSLSPQGCDAAKGQCDIQVQSYTAHGLNSARVAQAALKRLGSASGMTAVAGAGGGYPIQQYGGLPSPGLSPVPEVNVVVMTRRLATGADQYAAKLDGSRPLSGNWDTGQKGITGVSRWQTDSLVLGSAYAVNAPCTAESRYGRSLDGKMVQCRNVAGQLLWQYALQAVQTVVNQTVHQVHNCWDGIQLPAAQVCAKKPPPPPQSCPDGSPMVNGVCQGNTAHIDKYALNWVKPLDIYYHANGEMERIYSQYTNGIFFSRGSGLSTSNGMIDLENDIAVGSDYYYFVKDYVSGDGMLNLPFDTALEGAYQEAPTGYGECNSYIYKMHFHVSRSMTVIIDKIDTVAFAQGTDNYQNPGCNGYT